MTDLCNKVAVVTGAASGMGYSFARHALAQGMHISIADVSSTDLANAVETLRDEFVDAEIYSQTVDVSNSQQMQSFADNTVAKFNQVNFLFNNAGVGGGGLTWEIPLADWDWILGVNLKGVIHGVHAFTPHMLNEDVAHIVNTASVAGLMSTPSMASYTVSKHAVVALSEVLQGDLRLAQSKVGVSVLCPSFVNTKIYTSERLRPEQALVEKTEAQLAEQKAVEDATGEFFKTALSPDDVAELVFKAIDDKQFYILTHPNGTKVQVQKRLDQITNNGSPDVSGPEELPFD